MTHPPESRAAQSHDQRVEALFESHLDTVHCRRDRAFAWLMLAQWIIAVALAEIVSPHTWVGKAQATHLHVYYAIFLGGALTLPVIFLAIFRPGAPLTRYTVAVSQMMWSALLIHLTGGRIETHFHVFGSLAFLAFYRDWKVLLLGTLVVAADHFTRGLLWPESVYGIANPEWWRFLEHAGWVVFEDVVLVAGIFDNIHEMRAIAANQVALEEVNVTIERKVVERTAELQTSREQFRSLVEQTHTVPLQIDTSIDVDSLSILYVGPQAEDFLGFPVADWSAEGFLRERIHPDDRALVAEYLRAGWAQAGHEAEFRLQHRSGSWKWARAILSPSVEGSTVFQGLFLDVTDRRTLEIELRQAQKLESVGRLASGIAHEINTPIQFVGDSVHFVQDAFREILSLLGKYRRLRSQPEAAPALLAEIAAEEETADVDYLTDNVPKALERSVEGLDRVATLVRSMKEFAHPDQKEKLNADLNQALATTLIVARNEYKYVADIETDYGDVPALLCHVSELNQVFLNVIVNAAQAIGEAVAGTERRGIIRIATRTEGAEVLIAISDTGSGMSKAVREKVFDPFFTTKSVGKGTGQGLAIARNIVVDKHGGSLSVESELGSGATFTIRLPLKPSGTAEPMRAVAA